MPLCGLITLISYKAYTSQIRPFNIVLISLKKEAEMTVLHRLMCTNALPLRC